MVVRARDLGGCLGVDCLGPGLLRNVHRRRNRRIEDREKSADRSRRRTA